jgi:hypothetical protein
MNWKLLGSWCVVGSVLGYIVAIMMRAFPPVFWVLFMEGVVIAIGVISLLILLFRSINYLDWYYCRRKIS